MYILIHAHYLPRFFSLNVNSFKPKKYLISRYIPYYNDSEIKMQSVFLPAFLFLFVHIQHVVFCNFCLTICCNYSLQFFYIHIT